MGVDAMLEGGSGEIKGISDQRLDVGTYEGWFSENEAKIDWSASVSTVYNTIRAANLPGHGQG